MNQWPELSTPEHDKITPEMKAASQAIGDFCMWLAEHFDIDIEDETSEDIEDLLHDYHNIDQAKLEAEKDAMLDQMEAMNFATEEGDTNE